jgi:hypothetical protein
VRTSLGIFARALSAGQPYGYALMLLALSVLLAQVKIWYFLGFIALWHCIYSSYF